MMMKKTLLFILSITFCLQVVGQNLRVLNSFKQGSQKGKGNCASIAVIKASIDRYGVGNVFKSVLDYNTKRYFVMLQSGVELTLTFDEIKEAQQAAGFVESENISLKPIKLYADTCFAILAKHLQMDQSLQSEEKKYNKYSEALIDLNDGFDTKALAGVLGMDIAPFKARTHKIREKSGAVFFNVYHAVYSTYENYDEAGESDGVAPIEKFRFKRAGWKCGFIFCGPSGVFEIKRTNEY